MNLRRQVSILIVSCVLMSCSTQGQRVQVEKISEGNNIESLLKEKNLEYIRKDSANNLEANLFGEKMPEDNILFITHYTVDWEKETVMPNVYYESIPLSEPKFLTGNDSKLKYFIATVGNEGSIDERKMGVFDNEQVMTLKTLLSKKYGEAKKIEPKSSFLSSDEVTYLWKSGNDVIRLAISNECLCKDATSWSGDVRPKGGRYGQLTIYYNTKPEFWLEQFNYPEE